MSWLSLGGATIVVVDVIEDFVNNEAQDEIRLGECGSDERAEDQLQLGEFGRLYSPHDDEPDAIRAKLLAYLDFVQRGQLGPDGIVPRVLIGVPSTKRQADIQSVINSLPEPAEVMFTVALMPDVATLMASELMK